MPDISCFGKGIANGLPLSVLGGKATFMLRIPEVRFGSTFEGEAVSIAAALATIREVLEKDVCGTLANLGTALARSFSNAAERYGISGRLAGPAARPHLELDDHAGVATRELRWLCLQELARAGILTIGVFNVCYSHNSTDLESTAAAFETAMRALRTALDRGSVAGLLDERLLAGIRLAQGVR
jgi:glutamate-1-semialdehyde 2,1-aminomutase